MTASRKQPREIVHAQITRLTKQLRENTQIEYRPVKKIVKWEDCFAKVIEVPSQAMLQRIADEDLELTSK